MKFEYPTVKGTMIKRYKRFLADIKLEDQSIITAHVPNTGSMTGCWEPNWPCLLSLVDNPKRKLKYTLEMTHNGKSWIGVNTARTNKIVLEALKMNHISELKNYQDILSEVKYGESRLDFCLSSGNKKTFIEVKNVTLLKDGQYQFPDAVTTRGQKHLLELTKIAKQKNHFAVMLYLVQRQDGKTFAPAKDIDPMYGELLKKASLNKVKILAYDCKMDTLGITLNNKVKVIL